jgi:hypothetical protein
LNGRRGHGDGVELAVLAAFVTVAAWLLAVGVWRATAHGGVWPGTDGLYLEDQMQYLAWIRDASRHLLASNLFVLHATSHDFLEPVVVISAGLVAVGVAPWLALLLWQPVAILAVFVAVRALAHNQLVGRVGRRVGLVLALFGGGWAAYPDLWLPSWTWGYPLALLSLAGLVGSLLSYARARSAPRTRAWLPILLAGMAAWLHPWEGEVLVLVVLGSEAALRLSGTRPRPLLAATVCAGALVPLAYYSALAHWDPSWQLGQQASAGCYPLSTLALTLSPLAVPALFAYRTWPVDFVAAALRVWPPAALAVFLLAEHGIGNSPMHSFLGISVPLAILAVDGITTLRRRAPGRALGTALATAAAVALTAPAAIYEMNHAWSLLRPQPRKTITTSEWRALAYLSNDRAPGGVLSAWHLGQLIPAVTGRHTYIGNLYWSQPHPQLRSTRTWTLFNGTLSARNARAFVIATRARFLIADCHAHTRPLQTELAPIIETTRRFGCATVYQLGSPRPRREVPDRRLERRTQLQS